jgi:hypothetical protein
MGEELGERVGVEWVSMEKGPPQKAAATKANPRVQSSGLGSVAKNLRGGV